MLRLISLSRIKKDDEQTSSVCEACHHDTRLCCHSFTGSDRYTGDDNVMVTVTAKRRDGFLIEPLRAFMIKKAAGKDQVSFSKKVLYNILSAHDRVYLKNK